jgi:hypothetical protein
MIRKLKRNVFYLKLKPLKSLINIELEFQNCRKYRFAKIDKKQWKSFPPNIDCKLKKKVMTLNFLSTPSVKYNHKIYKFHLNVFSCLNS